MNEFEMVRLLRIAADMNHFAEDRLSDIVQNGDSDSLSENDLEFVAAAGNSGMSYQQFMKLVKQRGNAD